MECINSSGLSGHCEIIEKDSGLHFLIRFKTELSDEDLFKAFMDKGIHIVPLSQYFRDSYNSDSHTFILNYSNLELDKLKVAVEDMTECVICNS